ncbi:N-acetyltransferase [Marinilabiliaceae bacterium JC017]|nr:N-acetyltransferase [Marinilabiliaceae bacterium JC017]
MTTQNKAPLTFNITDNILLKQIEITDAPDLFNTIDTQRDYLGKWLPFVDFTKEVSDTESFIRSIIETAPESREYIFVIHCNHEFAGLIGFKDTDRLNRKTEIGYWLAESFQKKGIITRSVEKLCAFAFDELDMNRIQIKCAVGNTPSKKVPQRLSFTFEGIERDGELLSDGKFTDLEIYSKLAAEGTNS